MMNFRVQYKRVIIIAILVSAYSGLCFAIESLSNVRVGNTIVVAEKKGRLSGSQEGKEEVERARALEARRKKERTTELERLRKFRTRQKKMEKEKASVFKNNPVDLDRFVAVPGGCFEMGDLFGGGALEEGPVHEVCVNDFYMGKYEVTQKEWEALVSTFLNSNNPSCFKGCENCPVEKVSWNDVQAFVGKLREKTGMHYRLPTEAEWEYAARSGGKREKFAGTSDDSKFELYAWYGGNSGVKTHPVGQKKPNGLGLYDMSGNIKSGFPIGMEEIIIATALRKIREVLPQAKSESFGEDLGETKQNMYELRFGSGVYRIVSIAEMVFAYLFLFLPNNT